MPTILAKSITSCVCLALVAVGGGCNLFDAFDPNDGYVSLYGSHHRSVVDGAIPNGNSNARRFQNDQGWDITLAKAYVTTTAVQLVRCEGEEAQDDETDEDEANEEEERAGDGWIDGASAPSIKFRYGPCAENFISTEDTKTLELGYNRKVPAGRYCTVNVVFSPYPEDAEERADGWHDLPADDKVLGNTVYLRGKATKGNDDITFDFTFDGEVIANIDASQSQGGEPLRVRASTQPLPVVISKLYDQFFNQVDFSSSTYKKQLAKSVALALEKSTYVSQGTTPLPPELNQGDESDDDDDDDDTTSGEEDDATEGDDDDDDDDSDETTSEE